jgi:glycosyltransferase involved in cell wall biosynthesis/GT2 family glycosyltransferase
MQGPGGYPLKLLVVHAELPLHDRHAGSLRLFRLLDLLVRDGHQITFLARGGIGQERYAAQLLRLGVAEVIPFDPERLAAAGRPTPLPPLDFAALLGRGSFDAAWLCFHELAAQYIPLLREHSPRTKIIIDTVDVHWLREQRCAELTGDPAALAAAERTRLIESATYQAADALVAVSDEDAAVLSSLVDLPVGVVPTVHDVERDAGGPEGREGIIFVANFPHQPNTDAALDFAARTWPQVRAAVADAHLWLVGNEPPPSVRALAGPDVTVTGWVADIAPYLDRARVAIAPLRYGAGVKGKIGQAIARGIPVVTTPIGAEGMGLVDGEHVLIAKDADAFAAAIARLYSDEELWTRIAASAQRQLSERFGERATLGALRTLLADVAGKRGRSAPAAGAGRRSRRPATALAVQLAIDLPTAQAQLAALERAQLASDGEIVLVVSAHDPALSALASAASGARVVCTSGPPGTDLVRAVALEATSAEVVVVLGPLALPQRGFLEPLRAALASGAALAGPAIDGQLGFHGAADGSLWPRTTGAQQDLDALALDCLAARRDVWAAAPARGVARDGHYETQLGRWACAQGGLALAGAADVRRASCGPLSAIICTRDRASELPDAVGLLVAAGAARDGGEIVIVDNASSDATATVAAELAERYPGVRVVYEATPGLSRARNTGAGAARNALLCYLDDDARPGPGWREHIAWALTRPGVVAAGGPICALWPPGRQTGWPAPGLEQYLSVCERGDADRVLVPPDVAYGANWAIRRDALAAVGGFDSEFGLASGSGVNGDEVVVAWRLQRSGLGVALYSPLASVGHRIDPRRLNDRWMIERALSGGIEQARLHADGERAAELPLIAAAQAAADALLSALPLGEDLQLEGALERIIAADHDLAWRTALAHELGQLAANTLLLGEHEVIVGELRLRLRPEHLRGALQRESTPLASAEAA